jgi:HPr kinase/phosphorylase
MKNTLTARSVFQQHHNALELDWLAGEEDADRPVNAADLDSRRNALVGHLNLIRPNLIQVLGQAEFEYLDSLGKNSRDDAVTALFENRPLMIILAEQTAPPPEFVELAARHHVPLVRSGQTAHRLIDHLHYYLSSQLSEKIVKHGVFMEVMGLGVLLTGPSGVGKSELALELLSRGHRLVADDATEFRRTAPDTIHGSCPPMLADFLEVRGLGVLNVRAMYGNNAVMTYKRLHLIIQLLQPDETGNGSQQLDRLGTTRNYARILDVEIPEVILPVAAGRDLAVIIEAAVRNHVLYLNGYNAAEDFIARQQQYLDKKQS